MKNIKKTNGITMIEVLLSIAILAIVFAVALPILSDFKKTQSLRDATNDVVSLLNEARSKTLSGQGGDFYNVFFEEDKATLYKGSTYTDGDPENKEVIFDSTVTLPLQNIDLDSGSYTVSFEKLSGDTLDYGTIVLELESDSSINKTITILRTGLIN